MNVLAHMVLGGTDPERKEGQFLGDFCRGAVDALPFSPEVRMGIRGHRRVDALGDQHAFTRGVKSFLLPQQRRYGGLVLDLLCDWLLHENWNHISDHNKLDVLEDCEHVLAAPDDAWPGHARGFAGMILDHDLLHAYGHLSEIRYAVGRIGLRLRRPVDLQPILDRILRQERWLHDHFPSYFQDLQLAVADLG